MSDTQSEYGRREVPLIPGALYGMRAFSVRDDGTLGPLHRNKKFVYEPGVNVAECDDETWEVVLTFGNDRVFSYRASGADVVHKGRPVPDQKCSCGFYGYFDDAAETSFMVHTDDKHVNAIVRATGRCLVGDLGFKAQKMEVVGLVANDPATPESKRTRLMRFILDTQTRMHDGNFWRNYLIFVAIYWTWMIVGMSVDIDNAAYDVANQAMVLFLWSFVATIMAIGAPSLVWARRQLKALKTKKPSSFTMPSRALTQKMVEVYPDVPLFKSLEEAKEHFPISKESDLPQ